MSDQPITASYVEQLINDSMPDATVKVEGADGQHFEALVVSDAFEGKRPLARHRMVYDCLGDMISSGALHALSLRTLTPEQFAAQEGGE